MQSCITASQLKNKEYDRFSRFLRLVAEYIKAEIKETHQKKCELRRFYPALALCKYELLFSELAKIIICIKK